MSNMDSLTGDEHSPENGYQGGIKKLPNDIVKKIAAGQIIPSLSNVVKELIENSLDANSSIIEVKFKDYGKDLIEVSDNGEGIEERNFPYVALPHYTSKLQSMNEMGKIRSFGFRGEALASIAEFSNLSIITRHASSPIGCEVNFDHSGSILSQKSMARPIGTTIKIKNLFANYPVRRKEFEQSYIRNFNEMMQFIYPYALGYTNIRLIVNNFVNGRKNEVLNVEPKSIKENIVQLLGCRQMKAIQPFIQYPIIEEIAEEFKLNFSYKEEEQEVKIDGYVSHSDKTPSKLKKAYFFVNQRPISYAPLEKLIMSVYKEKNNMGNPFVLLFIDMGQHEIDLIVNPDKRTISLPKENLLLAVIKSSLLKMFQTTDLNLDSFSASQPSINSQVSKAEEERKAVEGKLHSIKVLAQSKIRCSSPCDSHISSSPTRDIPLNSSLDRHALAIGNLDSESMDTSSSRNLDDIGIFNPSTHTAEEVNDSSDSSFDRSARVTDVTDFVFRTSARYPRKPTSTPRASRSHRSDNSKVRSLDFYSYSKGKGYQRRSSMLGDFDPKQKSVADIFLVAKDHPELPNENDVSLDSSLLADLNEDLREEDITEDITEDFTEDEMSSHANSVNHKETSPVSSNTVIFQIPNIPENKSERIMSPEVQRNQPERSASTTSKNLSESSCVKSNANITEGKRKRKSDESNFGFEKANVRVEFSLSKDDYEAFYRKKEQPKGGTSKFFTNIFNENQEQVEKEFKKVLKKEAFAEMEILGQFNKGFILAKLEDDVFIIDQHASDERYNFEDLIENTVFESQRLFKPVLLPLTCYQESILKSNVSIFEKMGYKFVFDESARAGKRTSLLCVPASKDEMLGSSEIQEILYKMEETGGDCRNYRPDKVTKLLATRACHKSVRFNDPLPIKRMRTILNNMIDLKNPWVCAHGRPTVRFLFNTNEIMLK